LLASALVGGSVIAAPDPADHVELWYTTGSHQLRGLDTVTGQELAAYNGLTDLTGVAFADRDNMIISQSDASRGITRLRSGGTAGAWTFGSPYFWGDTQTFLRPQGIHPIGAGHVLAVDSSNHWVMQVPTGPSSEGPKLLLNTAQQLGTYFPRDVVVASSGMIIRAGTSIHFRGPGTSIPLQSSGFGLDPRGRIASFETPEGPKPVWHPFLYVAANSGSTNGIYRYDATTGGAWGLDDSDPTASALFIDANAWGIGLNDVAVSPDGYVYASGRDGANRPYIFRWNAHGQPAGSNVNDANDPRFFLVPADGALRLAIRPGRQSIVANQSGVFKALAGSAYDPRAEADVTYTSSAGVIATVELEDGTKLTGKLEVGGLDGHTKLRLPDGTAVDCSNLKVGRNGSFELAAGSTLKAGSVGLASGGLLDANGGSLVATTVVANGGQILSHNGAQVKVDGGGNLVGADGASVVARDGGVIASLVGPDGASLVGPDGGSLVGPDGASLVGPDGGSLVGPDGGSLVANTPLGALVGMDGASLGGNGTFEGNAIVLKGGSIAPGNSPGKLTLRGSLLMQNNSSFEAELAGVTRGVTYDQLDVVSGGGDVTLVNGNLVVRLLGGFGSQVVSSDTFTILTSGVAITGAFDNLTGGRVVTEDGLGSFAVGLSADQRSVLLSAFVASLPGDADHDGSISADDYALLDRGFAGALGGWANGDFNADGTIDAADYLLIDTSMLSQGGSAASAELLGRRTAQFGPDYVRTLLASVPEPSSAVAIGLAALGGCRRRKR
jgi:hypothetical protein